MWLVAGDGQKERVTPEGATGNVRDRSTVSPSNHLLSSPIKNTLINLISKMLLNWRRKGKKLVDVVHSNSHLRRTELERSFVRFLFFFSVSAFVRFALSMAISYSVPRTVTYFDGSFDDQHFTRCLMIEILLGLDVWKGRDERRRSLDVRLPYEN